MEEGEEEGIGPSPAPGHPHRPGVGPPPPHEPVAAGRQPLPAIVLVGLCLLAAVLLAGAIVAWQFKTIDIPGIKDDALPYFSDQPSR